MTAPIWRHCKEPRAQHFGEDNTYCLVQPGPSTFEPVEAKPIKCDFGDKCPGHASPDERPCEYDPSGYAHPEEIKSKPEVEQELPNIVMNEAGAKAAASAGFFTAMKNAGYTLAPPHLTELLDVANNLDRMGFNWGLTVRGACDTIKRLEQERDAAIARAEALALVAECEAGRERERIAMARAVRYAAAIIGYPRGTVNREAMEMLADRIESGEVEIP